MMGEYKKARITCKTVKEISVEELSQFLRYLNNIYKLIYLYATKRDTKYYYRRKLKDEEKLRISIVRKASPLLLEILIPAVSSAVPVLLLEIIKIIRDCKLNSVRRRLEIENLILQNELLRRKLRGDELLKGLGSEINKIIKLKEITIIQIEYDHNETRRSSNQGW